MSLATAGLAGVGTAVVCALVLIAVAAPLATDDLWFHLKMGETYTQQGLWPDRDPLLHTAGPIKPVQHEWLFGVAVYGAQRLLGFQGLRLLHAVVVAAILGLALLLFRRCGARWTIALGALTAFALLGWFRLYQLRPELVSMSGLLLVYGLALAPEAPLSRGHLAALALVMGLWANAHSLFLIGLLLLAAALLGEVFGWQLLRRLPTEQQDLAATAAAAARCRRLAAALALSFLVTLLNPRGLGQHLTFVTSSMGTGVWRIEDEWFPFFPFLPSPPHNSISLPWLSWLCADVVLMIWLAAAWRGLRWLREQPSASRLRVVSPSLFLVSAASLAAAFVSYRFLWLWILPLLFSLRVLGGVPLPARLRTAAGPTVALASALAAAALPTAGGWLLFNGDMPRQVATYLRLAINRDRYCDAGVTFLAESGLRGNLYNPYRLGGYLGYWLAPALRTFVDGRTEHYPAEVLDDYLVIAQAGRTRQGESFLDILDRRQVDVFFAEGGPGSIYTRLDTVTPMQQAPGWLLVFRSFGHAIYLRRSSHNQANLARVSDYYRRSGIPFDEQRGFDMRAAVIARPDWARDKQLLGPQPR